VHFKKILYFISIIGSHTTQNKTFLTKKPELQMFFPDAFSASSSLTLLRAKLPIEFLNTAGLAGRMLVPEHQLKDLDKKHLTFR
jgi:hypothetical protein